MVLDILVVLMLGDEGYIVGDEDGDCGELDGDWVVLVEERLYDEVVVVVVVELEEGDGLDEAVLADGGLFVTAGDWVVLSEGWTDGVCLRGVEEEDGLDEDWDIRRDSGEE